MHLVDMIFVRAQNAWFAARDEESGQTLVEYALIIALVAIAAIAALGFLRRQDPATSSRRPVARSRQPTCSDGRSSVG